MPSRNCTKAVHRCPGSVALQFLEALHEVFRIRGVKEVSGASLGAAMRRFVGARMRWARSAVFLIAVPATDATHYVLLLSGLARWSQDAVLARLQEASNASAMLDRPKPVCALAERPRRCGGSDWSD